jgi:hypothetical protein
MQNFFLKVQAHMARQNPETQHLYAPPNLEPAASDRPTLYPAQSPSYAIFFLESAADHMRYILLKVGPDRFAPYASDLWAKWINHMRTSFMIEKNHFLT